MSEVFEKFAEESAVTVMTRALMERALDAAVLDSLFVCLQHDCGAVERSWWRVRRERLARVSRDR